jgi:hypothetical protein
VEALLNPRETKKAKRGITLLHHPCLFERTIARSKFSFATVFGYHEAVRSQYRPAAAASEKIKRTLIFALSLVGRIEKDEIHRLRQFAKPLQHGSDASVLESEAVANLQRGKILPKSSQCGLSVFRKPHMLCSAAQRFDSNGPSAGIEIDEATAIQPGRKDIEERFTQAIAGGTGLHATRGE